MRCGIHYFDKGISFSAEFAAIFSGICRKTYSELVNLSDFASQLGELRYIEAVQEGGHNHQPNLCLSAEFAANSTASGHFSGICRKLYCLRAFQRNLPQTLRSSQKLLPQALLADSRTSTSSSRILKAFGDFRNFDFMH
jgi:hypothetical protein